MIAIIWILGLSLYGVVGGIAFAWILKRNGGKTFSDYFLEIFGGVFWPCVIPFLIGAGIFDRWTREKPELPTEVIPIKPVKLGPYR